MIYMIIVADDLHEKYLAITNTGIVLEDNDNSNLNAFDVNDEYWKKVSK